MPIGTIFSLDARLLDSSEVPVTTDPLISEQSVELVRENLEAASLADDVSTSEERTAASGTTCLTCGIGAEAPPFTSAEEQRAHFKTDWHRYNVKRRLAGLPHSTEAQFTALIENEDDHDAVGSLSGSESDDSDAGDPSNQPAMSSGPQFAFSGADGEMLGVWRCLVAPDKERGVDPPTPAACLAALQQVATQGGKCAVILLRGGHFAAAIYDLVRPEGAGAAAKGYSAAAADACLKEVAHKSFHKYVVRAKAGGKQSAKDATGKFAKSAGSRLRRHNEAALLRDVGQTLAEWRDALAQCLFVLVAAPGSNSQTLFAGDSPMLDRKDPRVRRVPFVTRRPTHSETKRVMRVMLTVYSLSPREAGKEEHVHATGEGVSEAEASEGGRNEDGSLLAAQAAKEEHAAEVEAARRKKAEKKARQKEREKEKRRAEAAEKAAAAAAAAESSAADEISKAAAQAAAMAQR